jgi:hypothetical protein
VQQETAMPADAPFAITDQAKRRILLLSTECEARIGKGVIAAILWIDSNLNNGMIESQPAIGFYDDRSAIEKDITIIDGLQIVIATSDEDKARFLGKTLDYENNRFLVR